MNILIYDISQQSGIKYPLKEAFESLGHQAHMFDWNKYLYTYRKANILERIKDRIFFEKTAKRINFDLTRIIEQNAYSLMIVVRGDHVYPETIAFAKSRIRTVVNWTSDDVFNPLNSTSYILDCFDKYDYIFSPRAHLSDEYLNKGARSFEVLHWYYRPGLLYPPKDVAKTIYLFDITFIGSWSKRREIIITPIETFNVNIWGWGWNKKAHRKFLSRIDCKPYINMKDMMDVFATSKINLNILTKENRDTTNFRNFEIPAACGFQLSERSDEILQLFEEDKEIVCFESDDDLKAKCDYYLKNETERQRIALSGYNRLINSDYSIVDRAKKILSVITR
jgi:spore maturation protein CgeB